MPQPAEPPAAPAPVPEEHPSGHHRHHGHPGSRPERDRDTEAAPREPGSRGEEAAAKVPAKVREVLRYVDENGRAPEGYEGGRDFHNAGAPGEKPLPVRDASGRRVTYREWDVNPKRPGVNRGAERLVTGSDGSAYYTADHYRTFQKIR